MALVIVDRIPLLRLSVYTTISVLIFSITVRYAMQMTSDPEWNINVNRNVNKTETASENDTESMEKVEYLLHLLLVNNLITKRLYEILSFMVADSFYLWTLVNMAYCASIILGKCIQKFVFGDLTQNEKQHIKETFWNFVYYKFIFMIGVMNIKHKEEKILWCGFFALVGSFHILSQLCRDRFEYLSLSPTIPKWTQLRLFALIFFNLAVSVTFCIIVRLYADLRTFYIISAEWVLVSLETLYVIVMYILYLHDVHNVSEKKGLYTHYIDLCFDHGRNLVDAFNNLYMLLAVDYLSPAVLIICWQINNLNDRIKLANIRHINYVTLQKYVERNYATAALEEIDANINCTICMHKMISARKLPCGHMFHTYCLPSWMETSLSCPVCRHELSVD